MVVLFAARCSDPERTVLKDELKYHTRFLPSSSFYFGSALALRWREWERRGRIGQGAEDSSCRSKWRGGRDLLHCLEEALGGSYVTIGNPILNPNAFSSRRAAITATSKPSPGSDDSTGKGQNMCRSGAQAACTARVVAPKLCNERVSCGLLIGVAVSITAKGGVWGLENRQLNWDGCVFLQER